MTEKNDAQPVAWRQRHQRVNGGDWAFTHRPLCEEERNVGWESEPLYSAATVEALREQIAYEFSERELAELQRDAAWEREAALKTRLADLVGAIKEYRLSASTTNRDAVERLESAITGATHD